MSSWGRFKGDAERALAFLGKLHEAIPVIIVNESVRLHRCFVDVSKFRQIRSYEIDFPPEYVYVGSILI